MFHVDNIDAHTEKREKIAGDTRKFAGQNFGKMCCHISPLSPVALSLADCSVTFSINCAKRTSVGVGVRVEDKHKNTKVLIPNRLPRQSRHGNDAARGCASNRRLQKRAARQNGWATAAVAVAVAADLSNCSSGYRLLLLENKNKRAAGECRWSAEIRITFQSSNSHANRRSRHGLPSLSHTHTNTRTLTDERTHRQRGRHTNRHVCSIRYLRAGRSLPG